MESTKILIIDDERVICEGCRLALMDKGYAVDACMGGRSGINAMLEGEYDLVLLDMKLPDMGGMEVLETLRDKRPGTYIIVMTGYSTIKNAVEVMKRGAFDYLTKPFSDDQLLLAVERVIDKKRLVDENVSLRKELLDRFGYKSIVGNNPKIIDIFNQIEKVAPTDSTVLLYGESGTGKELFARAIYAHSQRAARPFVAVDCSTLSPTLLESELFGHVKGAFTGAIQDKAGIFEVACDATLFLDDVANLSIEIQGKLLRVLEMQEYKPVGASSIKKTNVRIISATNKDLRAMVKEGTFREDLFYRFNVFPIFLPPLRERKEDIPKIAYHFLKLFCRQAGKRIEGFSDEALEVIVNHDWPGNVRELKNVIERLVIMSDRTILDPTNLLEHLQMTPAWRRKTIPESLKELRALKQALINDHFGQTEKAFLLKALKACNGNITHAAKKVGMQRPNFYTLMKKHHITAPK
ncbi:MAG: sigma-54 dependent transcriptional regulator [Desulfobacterales bacterium]|nr:sigma-54 dependent transcriptional regulator [Desulfobacterales bacterium]